MVMSGPPWFTLIIKPVCETRYSVAAVEAADAAGACGLGVGVTGIAAEGVPKLGVDGALVWLPPPKMSLITCVLGDTGVGSGGGGAAFAALCFTII